MTQAEVLALLIQRISEAFGDIPEDIFDISPWLPIIEGLPEEYDED